MAFTSKDGKRFTNRPPMMAHDRAMERGNRSSGLMERRDPLAQPGSEGGTGEMEPHHAAIHEHLRAMHEETGEAHSHVEHHADGSHTSHHVSAEGEISGPHHHENSDVMAEHMKSMAGGPAEGEGEDEPEYE